MTAVLAAPPFTAHPAADAVRVFTMAVTVAAVFLIARYARIVELRMAFYLAGLAVFAGTSVWGQLDRLGGPGSPRLPLITVAACLCLVAAALPRRHQ